MPIFLDTTGEPTLGIAVCARCGIKMPRARLSSDPNYPGLMVCSDDLDTLDPWRLAPRAEDQLVMEWVRPDVAIDGYGSTPVYVKPIQAVIGVAPPQDLGLGLIDVGGVVFLTLVAPGSWDYQNDATGLAAGNVWSNAGAVCVVLPTSPNPAALPRFYGLISAQQLQAIGGGDLPVTDPGVLGQLWNFAGQVCVSLG